MQRMKNVTIYTTSTCPYCKKLKEHLKDNGVDFDNIDVSQDQDKVQKMVDKSKQMGVPVVDIEGQIIVGFDKEKIDEALDL
ncbi:MAG: NrdH-redoxin [Candidatus Omnitrophica bacterium]|nr:NrdH-redoxin [Candidatus Omnitrophota bacterium]